MMPLYNNATGGPSSFPHQSSRDRSGVVDVVTTKDDTDRDEEKQNIRFFGFRQKEIKVSELKCFHLSQFSMNKA